MAAEQIITDNWYIYGITENTYYRFEAVFRFDSVTQALGSYVLYVDFYPALTGSDDLDFYLGATPTPSTMIATDEQDDFDIDVTDYITASPIYLKIADNYRSGDAVQTTAYIARCYLYTPGPTADGANWLDEDWPFRKQLPILNQSGAGTNYPVQVTVFKDDTEGAGNMSAEGHCNNDFSDIRFTARDGNTSLDHWLDHSYYVEGDYARFWIEVAENVSVADAKVYCYFGNPAASSESSGPDTFLFFDDFEWNNLTRWTTPGAYWSTQAVTVKYGSYSAYGDADSTSASRYLTKTLAQSTDFMVHIWWRATDVSSATAMYPLNVLEPDLSYMVGMDSADLYELYSATRYFYAQDVVAAGTWYRLEFAADYTNDLARLWLNDVAKTSQALKDGNGNDLASMSGLRAQTSSVADDDMYLDDYYVRRWQLAEPTFAAPEPIEIQDDAAPVIAATSYSPLNPSALTGVTLFAIITDAIGVEDVWFKAVAYPDGFADVSYHASEIGWNTWSYTFETLDDGVYCFVTYAIDTQFQSAAAYAQYQMFQVSTTTSIIISPITFFGVGDDFTQMQLSFDINRDCDYTIWEASDTYEEAATWTGSVTEGWNNIAWDKIVVVDELVDFGIEFANGSLTMWINGSYAVAQTTFYVQYFDHNGPDAASNVTVTGRITKLGSFTVYIDNAEAATGTLSLLDFEIEFTKTGTTEQAWHSWGIKFVNGSQTCWVNGTYYRWKYNADRQELGGQSLDALRAYQVAVFCLFAILGVGGYLAIQISGIKGGNFK